MLLSEEDAVLTGAPMRRVVMGELLHDFLSYPAVPLSYAAIFTHFTRGLTNAATQPGLFSLQTVS